MLDAEQRRLLRGMALALAVAVLVPGLGIFVARPLVPALPRLEDSLNSPTISAAKPKMHFGGCYARPLTIQTDTGTENMPSECRGHRLYRNSGTLYGASDF